MPNTWWFMRMTLCCALGATGCYSYSPSGTACNIKCDGLTCPSGLVCNANGFCGATETTCTAPDAALRDAAPSATGFTELAAGAEHACAIDALHQVYCWGSNASGQLSGTPAATRDVANTPQKVSLPSAAVGEWHGLTVGARHACGLFDDGGGAQLWCWGTNAVGQVGVIPDESGIAQVPDQLGSLWVEVAAGTGFSCARNAADNVYCWGANNLGQLGDGTNTGPRPQSQGSPNS